MKLKGNWNAETTYDVGDVVMYENGFVYHLLNACPAGTTPVDTRYWNQSSQTINDTVSLILDAVEGLHIPDNIDDDGIILKSGDDEYYVSVDASGESPEVVAELIVEEGGAS